MGSLTVKQIERIRPHCVAGLDFDRATVDKRREQGMMAIHGDGTDLEFWQLVDLNGIEASSDHHAKPPRRCGHGSRTVGIRLSWIHWREYCPRRRT